MYRGNVSLEFKGRGSTKQQVKNQLHWTTQFAQSVTIYQTVWLWYRPFPVCMPLCNKVFFQLPQPFPLSHKKPLFHANTLYPVCPNPHQTLTWDGKNEVTVLKVCGSNPDARKLHRCYIPDLLMVQSGSRFSDVETRKEPEKHVHRNKKKFRNMIQKNWLQVYISHKGQLLRGQQGHPLVS